VPISAILRDYLDEHLLSLSYSVGFVFGSENAPFPGTSTIVRANGAWKAAKLQLVTLHECRHTFASLMIAAGVNAKALSTYMGHATIGITLDRYGHLMPGNEDEAAGLLDAHLAPADTAARLAQLGD
jgi:integrase